MSSIPARFAGMMPDDFPFTVRCFDAATGELLWEEEVVGPGALQIKGMGRKTIVRITWPDGTVSESGKSERAGSSEQ